jgi:hypothetical protein
VAITTLESIADRLEMIGEDAARYGACAPLVLVSTKISLLTELGAASAGDDCAIGMDRGSVEDDH